MSVAGERFKAARGLIGSSQLASTVLLQVGIRSAAEFEACKPTLP
jgi:hypothetical protein